jgi:hypothetical protein
MAARSNFTPASGQVAFFLRQRLQGPGGWYNLGNGIGLGVGLGLQIGAVGAAQGVAGYLAGNASAVALTVATLIFFYSGEVYHRAWANGAPPDARLNRMGDLSSAVGAIALGLALLMLGQPVLALFSGLLHAVGKLGSALPYRGARAFWPGNWPDPWRSAVLASRVPAIVAALYGLWYLLTHSPAGTADLLMGISLLASYACWTKADLLLFRS